MKKFDDVDEYFILKHLERCNFLNLGFGEKLQDLVKITNKYRDEKRDYISKQNLKHHMLKMVGSDYVEYKSRHFIITSDGKCRIKQLELHLVDKDRQLNKDIKKVENALRY